MRNFTIQEQVAIFNGCKTALELLEYKILFEEIQNLTQFILKIYDYKMSQFLELNIIA